jgi:predicted ribosomally synthesized peptide with SipW-like signal peptide
MIKILLSLAMIALVSSAAVGATKAYFSDTETSNGNTFTAGSLDLAVGANNGVNTIMWTVVGLRPGNMPIRTYHLNNVGSMDGFLDLENISVTNNENGCLDPEIGAGDSTCGTPGAGEGELQNIAKLQDMFWDNDCDGWYDTGDVKIYTGPIGAIASHYETNRPLAAGASQCLTGQAGWWSSASDNLAMGDDLTLNMSFELGQDASQ